MSSERASVYESSRSRFAGLLLASLAALAGGCTTAARAPGTAEAVDQAPAAAIAEHREAIRLDPNSAAAHAGLGSALVSQGELEEALAEFREASRLEPTNAILWNEQAIVYEQMGRGEDALHSLETGLEANPGNAGILNQMGWLYATAENPTVRDPAKALAYAQRAVEASNASDANVLDTLAEAYYANQEFDEAIKAEERALEIAPGLEVFQSQLEKFREAKANEGGR
jgi:tetratricopeptide (TPR) repeat protein